MARPLPPDPRKHAELFVAQYGAERALERAETNRDACLKVRDYTYWKKVADRCRELTESEVTA